jgi:hypothetical protein
VGTTLFGYRSTDGINWTGQGSTSLTDQQADMYVGTFFAAETGNIWPAAGFDVWGPLDPTYDRLFVAQFRNVGDVPAGAVVTPVKPTIYSIRLDANGRVVVTYTGLLMSSPTVNGTYTDIPGSGTPYIVPPSGGAMYFRARAQ